MPRGLFRCLLSMIVRRVLAARCPEGSIVVPGGGTRSASIIKRIPSTKYRISEIQSYDMPSTEDSPLSISTSGVALPFKQCRPITSVMMSAQNTQFLFRSNSIAITFFKPLIGSSIRSSVRRSIREIFSRCATIKNSSASSTGQGMDCGRNWDENPSTQTSPSIFR
uniref:Putative secreted protein n=1 Tax=Anopheles marajoara TaxID=58244 RepID=A0A2M4C6J0_9DIPT